MRLFRENAGGIMDTFSRDFEVSYLETLRRRHGTQRMNANNVYQEVIQDRDHIHMNSTKWATLSDFVQYLGKKGLVVAEDTERGWYVTYIDRDPNMLARREAVKERTEADAREERREAQRRESMRTEAARALDRAGCVMDRTASMIGNRDIHDDGRVDGIGVNVVEMKLTTTLELGGLSRTSAKAKRKRGISLLVEEDDDEDDDEDKDEADGDTWKNASNKSAKSNVFSDNTHFQEGKESNISRKSEAVTNDFQRRQQQRQEDEIETINHRNDDNNNHNKKRKDYWLHREILVRIISKTLNNGEYYKRKAIVKKVIDKFVAECEVLDGGDILQIDQDDLETVIPKMVGEKVRIVNGRYRGMKAMIQKLDKGRYCAELKLSSSSLSGDDIDRDKIVVVDYEDFSAIA
jgi:DNA/RNA-binding protein KIN17